MASAVVEMKKCLLSKRKRHHIDEDHKIHLRATLQQQSYYENLYLLIYRTIKVYDKVLSSPSHSETTLGLRTLWCNAAILGPGFIFP